MTLPNWVQGPSKKRFTGNPSSITVYLNTTSKFSEAPYILATIQAALAFDKVKIVIPDTLEYQNKSMLPDNHLKSEQALYEELRKFGKDFYKKNVSYFEPLIDKVGQEEWEKDYLKYWDDYRLSQEFVDAKEVIRKICAYEKEESNNLVAQVNNSLTDDANIFTLSQAIERTAQTRLNCLWATKNKKYDLSSSRGIQIINYIYDELAQLLVEALEVKAKFAQRPSNDIDGHAILYAGKLSPAMYKLFQIIKSKDEHKYFSSINNLLKLYKIPEYLMQPLSINWNDNKVKDILEQYNNSIILTQEGHRMLTQQSVQAGYPIINSQKISPQSFPVKTNEKRMGSRSDGPSLEELLETSVRFGARIKEAYDIKSREEADIALHLSMGVMKELLHLTMFPPHNNLKRKSPQTPFHSHEQLPKKINLESEQQKDKSNSL